MSEYISREAAIRAINAVVSDIKAYSDKYCEGAEQKIFEQLVNGILSARQAIIEIPAADVAPIVRGMWLASEGEANAFTCEKCGKTVEFGAGTTKDNEFNHCPRCGAELHALYERQEADHA